MSFWRSLARREGPARGQQARLDLARAYRALFSGHGGKEEAEIVLADLANVSGFYRVNDYGVSGEDRAHGDGRRAVYGRVLQHLAMSEEELRGLEEAARVEALASAQQGEI